VPELKKDTATGAMHGIGDAKPAGNLLVGENAGRIGTAGGLLGNRRSFGNNQARRRPL